MLRWVFPYNRVLLFFYRLMSELWCLCHHWSLWLSTLSRYLVSLSYYSAQLKAMSDDVQHLLSDGRTLNQTIKFSSLCCCYRPPPPTPFSSRALETKDAKEIFSSTLREESMRRDGFIRSIMPMKSFTTDDDEQWKRRLKDSGRLWDEHFHPL